MANPPLDGPDIYALKNFKPNCAFCNQSMPLNDTVKKQYIQALKVIETLSMVEHSPKKALEEIYEIAHSLVGECENPHFNWQNKARNLQEEIKIKE